MGLATGTTDAGALRFTGNNERLCDYAHPDPQAGFHKHTLTSPETNWLHYCMACGRTWEPASSPKQEGETK